MLYLKTGWQKMSLHVGLKVRVSIYHLRLGMGGRSYSISAVGGLAGLKLMVSILALANATGTTAQKYPMIKPTVEQLRDYACKLNPVNRSIRTLDPTRLSEADFVDLSSLRSQALIYFLMSSPRREVHLNYSKERFSDTTGGFLYYLPPAVTTPLAGEIRFRLTNGPDPNTFHLGRDLPLPNGLPWSLPVLTLSPLQQPPVFELLLRDLLIDEAIVDRLLQMSDDWQKPTKRGNIIHDLDQPFMHNLSSHEIVCHFVGDTSLAKGVRLVSPFSFRMDRRTECPLSGESHHCGIGVSD